VAVKKKRIGMRLKDASDVSCESSKTSESGRVNSCTLLSESEIRSTACSNELCSKLEAEDGTGKPL